MNRASFTLSLDFELAWGTLDRGRDSFYRPLCRAERQSAVTRLLDLFERHDISATWAIVGSMFEPGDDDLLHAPDLIEKIQECRIPQEIGSHTYTHAVMSGLTRDAARVQFAKSVEAAKRAGVDLRTIIFPRNQVAHLDLAREYGFTCFRSPEPRWYCRQGERGAAARLGHLMDVLTAATPAVSRPMTVQAGMLAVPGSMLYTPSFGHRRWIPPALRVSRAIRGLERAVREKGLFHLWFHPTDIVVRMDEMLDGLEQILTAVNRLRRSGEIMVCPMKDHRWPLTVHDRETASAAFPMVRSIAR
jgi:hypothetical protein